MRYAPARKRSRGRWALFSLAGLAAFVILGSFVYNLPFVQERLGWRVSALRAEIQYAISPPEEAVFQPDEAQAVAPESTLPAEVPEVAAIVPTEGAAPAPTEEISPTATTVPVVIPASHQLSGIRHEYQQWNNCGPANLSMMLSYWGWSGDQRPVASFVKPNPRDKNVMPYELAAFVELETDFKALTRVAGDLELLKQLIAAGFPVVVEKGFEGPGFDGWMGHYEVVSGYDDSRQQFTVQDSYIVPDLPISYDEMEQYWRHFNYTYVVVYTENREEELMNILGSQADELTNDAFAAQLASEEIFASDGRQQFFAWFNRGTNLVSLQDYAGAAAAYDEAFAIYGQIDPEIRPWRIMWYQTGPYWAYFYSGRYGDVITLSTQTLDNMSEPVLEESFYWRGLAREALGDVDGAISDWRSALNVHPGWEPALQQLQRYNLNG